MEGIFKIAKVAGIDALNQILLQMHDMTDQGHWRVRKIVFELYAFLGVEFGKDIFEKRGINDKFFTYLQNTAAAVRELGIQKSEELGSALGREWIIQDYIPKVI